MWPGIIPIKFFTEEESDSKSQESVGTVLKADVMMSLRTDSAIHSPE